MVPMLTCGLVRSNFAFATLSSLDGASCRCTTDRWDGGLPGHRAGLVLLAGTLGDDLLGHVRRYLGVRVELHRVARAALGLRPQVADVAEHLRQRDERLDDAVAAALLHRLDHAATAVEV